MRLHMRDVTGLAGGVDHDEEMIAAIGEHQVIKDATRVIGEKPVTLPPGGEREHIDGHQRFERQGQRFHAAFGLQEHLPHVADIKKPGGGAAMQMFGHDAQRVLHRHVIAREGHHTGAKLAVQMVKAQLFQITHAATPLCSTGGHCARHRTGRIAPASRCPLCPCPEPGA